MTKKYQLILKSLKQKGCRLTTVRKAILSLFATANNPLSSLDIQKSLTKNKIRANKTTVYRELDFLKNLNIIEEFQFSDRIKRYEISSDHHHHIICIKCNKTECVTLAENLKKQEKIIEKNKKFKIVNHSLEFYGFCHACRQAGHSCQVNK